MKIIVMSWKIIIIMNNVWKAIIIIMKAINVLMVW
jgi:hypothetical protein